MDNSDRDRLRAFDEIEEKVDQLREMINMKHSRGASLLTIDSFLTYLFKHHDPLFIEATFSELFPFYLKLLSLFTVSGSPPGTTRSIIGNARRLHRLRSGEFKDHALATEIKRLLREYKELKSILLGKAPKHNRTFTTTCFPVIESVENDAALTYLEGLDVKVSPGNETTKYIIHPTYKDEDPILIEQVRISFEVALKTVPRGKKPLPASFEVMVFFKSNLGNYSGNSFGSLLTMLFIRELVKLNSPNMIPDINPGSAFTGAVDESGRMISVGRSNMIRKVKSIFFSGLSRFIVPHADEATANAVVEKLNKRWPKRKLEIIAVKEISEIMNRRDLFLISRKPVRQRIKETAQRYRHASWLAIPFFVLLGILYAREFDNNPVAFELEGTNLNIKNRFGVVLWSWAVHWEIPLYEDIHQLKSSVRIIDVDNDGLNEVIASGNLINPLDFRTSLNLYCFKGERDTLWRFSLTDTVSSPKELNIPSEFAIRIFDTVTVAGKGGLLVYGNSQSTFPAAVFFLDPRTGRREGSTLWTSGHICQIAVSDVNSDQKKDLVFLANDNGYKIMQLVAVELPLVSGMLPAKQDYFLEDKDSVIPLFEIRLPVTDFSLKYSESKRDIFLNRNCMANGVGEIGFYSRYSLLKEAVMYKLILNSESHAVEFLIDSRFARVRDSLVNLGKLPPPYTDTKEYTDNLKNGVRYKLNGEWVTYQEYLRSGAIKPKPKTANK